jgi:hypothetical protein
MRFAFFLLLLSITVRADQITIPNSLSNGTVANANAVNANFDALAAESNDNDARIGTLEANVRRDDTDFNLVVGSGLQNLTPDSQNDLTASYNTAVGLGALDGNTTGYLNTAVGINALYLNSTGAFNSAYGNGALYSNADGSENTALGSRSLYTNSSGQRNTAVGRGALQVNLSGSKNTAIGFAADVASDNLTNATAIGNQAQVDASNKVRIGNTDVTVIQGQVAFTSSSDARLKDSITPVSDGLALVNDLNPVSYHRTANPAYDIEMGLLAQEVEATLKKHGLGNSGMVHQPTEGAYLSLRYNDLLAPMIKAIQELDAQHKKEVAVLEKQLKSQQDELLVIVQSQQVRIVRLESMLEPKLVAR